MDSKLCEVKIPNGVVGDIYSFRNYDPKRIPTYKIEGEQLLLYMTEQNRQLALQEFKEVHYTFYEAVHAQELPEVMAYCNFIVEDDLTVLTFYMKQSTYRQDLLTAVIELALVLEAFYYQIYAGMQSPTVTVRYVTQDGASVYEEVLYDKIAEPSLK